MIIMAARSLDLLVNVQSGTLLSSFNSTSQGNIPGFVFGDATPVSVRLVEPSGVSARPWREIDLTGQSLRIGIGIPGAAPTAGTFTLTYGGNTTTALNYDASAAQVAAALNALASITSAGGVTVSSASSAYKVVFNTVGTRTAITAGTGSLSPTSGAYISTVLAGSVSAAAIYLVKLEAMPAAFVELGDDLPSAAITATTVREGATGVSEIQSLSLDPVPYDGTYTLTIASQETVSLAYDSTAAEIQAALGALVAVGSSNVTVSGDFPYFTVTFAASLGNIGAITGNASALTVPAGRKGILSNNTTGIAELLASRARVDATLEIELTDDVSGDSWTPLQMQCVVREDVIPSNPASQTELPTYLLESVASTRYIRYDTPQSLTAPQKAQATANIGAETPAGAQSKADIAANAAVEGLLSADNSWEGVQSYGNTLTTNGLFLAGPLASFSYLGSTAAAHRTALGVTPAAIGAETPAGAAAQIAVYAAPVAHGIVATQGKPVIRSIAFMGDSITGAVGTTLLDFERNGYVSWLKIFLDEEYTTVPAATSFSFATGGAAVAAIRATWFDLVMATNADAVFVHLGTNNHALGTTSQATADLIVALWLDIRSGGKIPIGTSILPVVGNATKSTWIVATNALLRDAAAQNGVLFCDWTGEIENVLDSNTGVSNTTYVPDNIHPGEIGASRMARYAARYLRFAAKLGNDPYLSARPVSRNVRLAGSSGQPTAFQNPFMPSGATLNSKTLIADPETGGFWLELNVTAGSATSNMALQHDFSAAPEINGMSVFALAEIQVVSGSFNIAHAFLSVTDSGTKTRRVLANTAVTINNNITAADGLLRCKSPAYTPIAQTYYTAPFQFLGTGVIRVRRLGLYRNP